MLGPGERSEDGYLTINIYARMQFSEALLQRRLRVAELSLGHLRLPPSSPATSVQSTLIPHENRANQGVGHDVMELGKQFD